MALAVALAAKVANQVSRNHRAFETGRSPEMFDYASIVPSVDPECIARPGSSTAFGVRWNSPFPPQALVRGIVCRHLADQRLAVVGRARSARRLWRPAPEDATSLAVPSLDRSGLNIDQPLAQQCKSLSQEVILGHQHRPRTCSEGNQSAQIGGNQSPGSQAVPNDGKVTERYMACRGLPETKGYRPTLAGSEGIAARSGRVRRAVANGSACYPPCVKISFTTVPNTSVSRKSRPA